MTNTIAIVLKGNAALPLAYITPYISYYAKRSFRWLKLLAYAAYDYMRHRLHLARCTFKDGLLFLWFASS